MVFKRIKSYLKIIIKSFLIYLYDMDVSKKYIARILFKERVLEDNGSAFESFFSKIMRLSNKNFKQVKPQGQIGDKKNDGFDQCSGIYYQVYAPECIKKQNAQAVAKLKTDFNGLIKYWNSISPIKEFYFVINDKYCGVYPTIYDNISTISKEQPKIKVGLFLTKDLEDICMNLDDETMTEVFGIIPDATGSDIDYEIMRDVVQYLVNIKTTPSKELIPENPDFNKKIVFNKLSNITAGYLKCNRANEYAIKDYFQLNSNYAKEELRNIFSGLYKDAVQKLPESDDKPDCIFWYIYDKSYSEHTIAVNAVILTLMSYYFEYCDIFKIPDNDFTV
jgi:hypothetical protein